MEKLIAAEKEALVDIVKLSQKRKLEGKKGSWKDFLKIYDRKLGISISDPARRSVDDLIAFIKTFSKEEDLKLFEKVLGSHLNRKAVRQMIQSSAELESPEQKLVRLTLEHPEYPGCYSFPSFEKDWVVTKLHKISKVIKSNKMFAVDCEMVLCENGTEAVVKVSLVDQNLEVKLDELVNPNMPIIDYRTEITGISAKDLKGVTCSLLNVQTLMKKHLSHGAILVGHSLNNDLQALKFDHARVIDTCFIFNSVCGPTRRRPSLNDLCKAVLGYEVRKEGAPHNCVDDARAAMKLVLAKLKNGYENGIKIPSKDVPETERAKLLIHRIPKEALSEELQNIFPGFTLEIQPRQTSRRKHYSSILVFMDQKEADKAFDSIDWPEEKDSCGLPHKGVSLTFSTMEEPVIVYVRKMLPNVASLDESTTKKRSALVDSLSEEPKKSKKSKINTSSSENHVEEIENLKLEIKRLTQELKHRDEELRSLQKIVAALTRKQGL